MTVKNRTITLNGIKFILGKIYRDTMTNVSGKATAGAQYLTGCDQIKLSNTDTTGRPYDHWVDVTCIEGVEVKEVPGGPAPTIPSPITTKQRRNTSQ